MRVNRKHRIKKVNVFDFKAFDAVIFKSDGTKNYIKVSIRDILNNTDNGFLILMTENNVALFDEFVRNLPRANQEQWRKIKKSAYAAQMQAS